MMPPINPAVANPHERKNLALDPARASTIAKLRKLLHEGPVAKDSPVRSAIERGVKGR